MKVYQVCFIDTDDVWSLISQHTTEWGAEMSATTTKAGLGGRWKKSLLDPDREEQEVLGQWTSKERAVYIQTEEIFR